LPSRHSIEAFARICVSGLLLDPEIPVSLLFTSPFGAFPGTQPGPSSASVVSPNASLHRQPSTNSQGPLSRDLSLRQRLHRVQDNFKRPFALPAAGPSVEMSEIKSSNFALDRLPSDTVSKPTSSQFLSHHARDASQTQPPQTLRMESSRSEFKSLPFQLSISRAHEKTHRNLPYLRHSWSRIDIIAILGFWISFALAMTGSERSTSRHIGAFRALSVLRTARLLTITSGTTVMSFFICHNNRILTSRFLRRPLCIPSRRLDHSWPALRTSCSSPWSCFRTCGYPFIFASLNVALVRRIIGMQAFSGSLRRSCYITPTLGESRIRLNDQLCGGHIDPSTLLPTGFITGDNKSLSIHKGYVCPLGQVCIVGNISFPGTIHLIIFHPISRRPTVPTAVLQVLTLLVMQHCKLSLLLLPTE
jgi:hypothetical protein